MASRCASSAQAAGRALRAAKPSPRADPAAEPHPPVAAAWTFARGIAVYGARVFPAVRRELASWRSRAEMVPDQTLRRLALRALSKRGNMEGAALFAAFAPRASRAQAVRALVAFQAIYNYLDVLVEQPRPPAGDGQGYEETVADGRHLHAALLVALQPAARHGDYYALHRRRDDGGYLPRMVDACRTACAALPSFAVVAPTALRMAERIVEFQSLNVGERDGGPEGLERWALEQQPAAGGLCWWETAAAAGSSLGVHALLGLATDVDADADAATAIDGAFFPWIGALHSLLDSAVDVAEDRDERQRNLLGYYRAPEQAAARTGLLARRAVAEARALGGGRRHEAVVAAMIGYYLSAREVSGVEARALATRVSEEAGSRALAARTLLRVARPLARRAYEHG
jgi:tetraprenyl-beta-curcumene synthase